MKEKELVLGTVPQCPKEFVIICGGNDDCTVTLVCSRNLNHDDDHYDETRKLFWESMSS